MLCPNCGTKNRAGALFCASCHGSLEAAREAPRQRLCSTCATKNEPGSRFCRDCGHELGVPAALQRRVTARRVVTVGTILGLLLLVQLIGASAIVLALAILPALFYFTLAVWIDRYEPEPWWLVTGAFLWGASAAVLISGIVNTLGSQLVSSELGEGPGNAYGASISAPFIEETTKGAVLLYVFLRRRYELNGLLDGVVYASMVGLGFAMTENVQYYGNALQEGGTEALGATFVLRGVVLPFLHPLFTSMTGIGLVLALRAQKPRTRAIAPFVGLGLAMVLHSAWNTNPVIFGPLLLLPVFVFVVMLVRRSIRSEAQVIHQYLPEDLAAPADVARLESFRGRLEDSVAAFRQGGFRGLQAREEYVGALSDLAFSRAQAARSPVPAGAAPADAGDRGGFRDLVLSLRREWTSPTTREDGVVGLPLVRRPGGDGGS